jgi:hypothetical protein
MKKPKPDRIPMSRLSAFAKAVSGRPTANGESLLAHAAECLRTLGIEQPQGMSARAFVHANRAHVLGAPVGKPVAAPIPAVATDAFLRSYEWRRVRMQALKKYGNRCQCCGASPITGAVINVDHIKPRKLFPDLALTLENLQVLCADCNHGKGNWDMTDWRQESEA